MNKIGKKTVYKKAEIRKMCRKVQNTKWVRKQRISNEKYEMAKKG